LKAIAFWLQDILMDLVQRDFISTTILGLRISY